MTATRQSNAVKDDKLCSGGNSASVANILLYVYNSFCMSYSQMISISYGLVDSFISFIIEKKRSKMWACFYETSTDNQKCDSAKKCKQYFKKKSIFA